MLDRFLGRLQREVDHGLAVIVRMAVLALRPDLLLDLAAEVGAVGLHRQALDVANRDVAPDDAFPERVGGGSLRGDRADAGDDDSSGFRHGSDS